MFCHFYKGDKEGDRRRQGRSVGRPAGRPAGPTRLCEVPEGSYLGFVVGGLSLSRSLPFVSPLSFLVLLTPVITRRHTRALYRRTFLPLGPPFRFRSFSRRALACAWMCARFARYSANGRYLVCIHGNGHPSDSIRPRVCLPVRSVLLFGSAVLRSMRSYLALPRGSENVSCLEYALSLLCFLMNKRIIGPGQ